MVAQIPVPDEAVIARPASGEVFEVASDVASLRLGIVNVVLIGPPGAGDRSWVLVDADVTGYRGSIEKAAAKRFGDGARPAVIIMRVVPGAPSRKRLRLVCRIRRRHPVSSCFKRYDHLTRPLRSTAITAPSSLLWVGPPQLAASVLSPRGFRPLVLPWHQQASSCSSAQKPVTNSRPLYAGRRPHSHPCGLVSGEKNP